MSRGITQKKAAPAADASEDDFFEIPAPQEGVLPFSFTNTDTKEFVSSDTLNDWLRPQSTTSVKNLISGLSKDNVLAHTAQMGKAAQAFGNYSKVSRRGNIEDEGSKNKGSDLSDHFHLRNSEGSDVQEEEAHFEFVACHVHR